MQSILNRSSLVLRFAASLFPLVAFAVPVQADIYQWEYVNPADPSQGKQQSTTLAPDGAGIDAVLGAYIEDRDLTMAFLMNADLRNAYFIRTTLKNAGFSGANLSNTKFGDVDLTGASFREAKLTNSLFGFSHGDGESVQRFATLTDADFTDSELDNVSFYGATLTNVNFTGADVRGASFSKHALQLFSNLSVFFGTGITPTQLSTTASYQAHNLSGIDFIGNLLAEANFAGQNLANASFAGANLTGANFREANVTNAGFLVPLGCVCGSSLGDPLYATLTDADFTAADARGAYLAVPASAITTNLIRPDGHIRGLDLDSGGLLVVRDYDGNSSTLYVPNGSIPIAVDQLLTMGPGGTLRMVFEADAWNSTISFAPGIPVALDGTLELAFAADVNLASQVGRTFDLFDWTGVSPTGAFVVASPYVWDLSNLYTTGQVTLTAVSEPASIAIASVALAIFVVGCSRLSLKP